MSEYVIPEPEPKEIDETLSIELRHLAANAVLKGKPSGSEKCENCRYYLEPYNEISYCWHRKLRILVVSECWCEWWGAIPVDEPEPRVPSSPPGSNGAGLPSGPVARDPLKGSRME